VAALKHAGFNRAAPMYRPTLQEHTSGWQVRQVRGVPGYVDVRWVPCSLDLETDETRQRRTVRALLRYADALIVAGFKVRLAPTNDKLTVYARRT
jgi:hypothetical protein